MFKTLFLRGIAAFALAGVVVASHAANITRNGNLLYNTDVVRIDFTVAAPGAPCPGALWLVRWPDSRAAADSSVSPSGKSLTRTLAPSCVHRGASKS